MTRIPSLRCSKGIAAVELAVVAPVLLLLLLGLTDVAMVNYDKLRVEEAVNAGVQYAMGQGKSVNTGKVAAVVQAASTLKSAVAVTVGNDSSSTSFVAGYCHCFPEDWDGSNLRTPPPSRQTTVATGDCLSSNGVTGNCASGSELGRYLVIKGRYTYEPILPMSAWISIPQIQEAAVVRIN